MSFESEESEMARLKMEMERKIINESCIAKEPCLVSEHRYISVDRRRLKALRLIKRVFFAAILISSYFTWSYVARVTQLPAKQTNKSPLLDFDDVSPAFPILKTS
jgi:hypothetical protein